MIKIVEIKDIYELLNEHNNIFDPVNKISFKNYHFEVEIVDLRDDKNAIKYIIKNDKELEFFNCGLTFSQIVQEVQTQNFSETLKNIIISISKPYAAYSPFRESKAMKFNPIKKVTKATIKNLFYNRKIARVFCGQYLTDDYAFDASVNFQEGFKDVETFYYTDVLSNWYFHILYDPKNPKIKTIEGKQYYIIPLYNSWSSYDLFVEKVN